MMRTKTPLLAMLLLGLGSAWMASCSDDEAPTCTPNETRVCAGLARCEGVQACLSDGSGWGECDCTAPPREGDGKGGTSGEGPTAAVGARCAQDGDCTGGLTCIRSTSNEFLGGGPAGGYCSLNCASDVECTAIDEESECVVSAEGAAGLCLRTCLSQDPRSLAENKCLGRVDLACNSEAYLGLAPFSGSRQAGWCYPQCASDADCGSRRCDLARGLCVDTLTEGLPIGSRCTQHADCAGRLCIGLADGEAFCSAPCVFGLPIGCGYGVSAQTRGAACFLPQQQGFLSSEGRGDVGFCTQLCSENADCTQAERGWVCDETDDAVERFNRPGYCDLPDPTDGGVDGGDDASTPSQPPPSVSDAG
jgi:hypothetical protein